MDNASGNKPNYYDDGQNEIGDRYTRGELSVIVYIDPNRNQSDYWYVVVRRPTGIVYQQQCSGLIRAQRLIEGYLVPVPCSVGSYDANTHMLRQVFHDGGKCQDWFGEFLPAERLKQLASLVNEIEYSHTVQRREIRDGYLVLDRDRLNEVAEGWIPVLTPDGPGVLLYLNCS